jgi:hypothetical protein
MLLTQARGRKKERQEHEANVSHIETSRGESRFIL